MSSSDQAFSAAAFARYELPFTKHTNAWVPFVILSVSLLKPGGRLGMVIPAELLHVLHATSLRKYLLRECSKILVIDPNELLFEEALQGTVLLMVERKKSQSDAGEGVSIVAAPNNEFLNSDPDSIFDTARFVSGDVLNGKWMKVLLSPKELEVFGGGSAGRTEYSRIPDRDRWMSASLRADQVLPRSGCYGCRIRPGNYAPPMFGQVTTA